MNFSFLIKNKPDNGSVDRTLLNRFVILIPTLLSLFLFADKEAVFASLRNLEPIMIGSRFLNEANTASLSANRNKLSKVGISITNLFSNVRSTDPLSGLFLIRKEKFTDVQEKLYKDGRLYIIFLEHL